jgi:hypothetical protein
MSDDDRPVHAQDRAPAPQGAAKPGEHVWTVQRSGEARRGELRSHGQWGAEFQLFANGTFVYGRQYLTRDEALARAEDERKALLRNGWWPVGDATES